jgi:DNA-directed RNA polymerase subunit RPC12/RpoP
MEKMPKIGDRLGEQVWRRCPHCGEEHWCPESHIQVELWRCSKCGREIEHIVGRPLRKRCLCGGERVLVKRYKVPGFTIAFTIGGVKVMRNDR